MATSLAETIKATTSSFVHTWTTPSWQDSAAPNLALRAPECEHVVLPQSLGLPARNNAEWAAFFARVAPLVTDSTMTVHDLIVVAEERRSVCRTSLVATTPVGEYRNEYIWFLWFDETGEKITRIVEFIDRKAAEGLLAQLKEEGYVQRH